MDQNKELLAAASVKRDAMAFLSARDRRKYELARELGLLEKVQQVGWAGLSAKETGRIGGKMGRGSPKH